jgi:agmatinase
MSDKLKDFNPSGVGIDNGNFIGLPFDEATANIIFQPVPWEVTTSYTGGTATGSENIRRASVQLDLMDTDVPDAWKMGIFMREMNEDILMKNKMLRTDAEDYIKYLENGKTDDFGIDMTARLQKINEASETLNNWVYEKTKNLLKKRKLVGLVGGDHSTPLGYLRALSEEHEDFGILQIDAHCDLRNAYEGFEYSHASIFYNALKISNISKLVQVGIRDFCEEELDVIKKSEGRIQTYYDHRIKNMLYEGMTFQQICQGIIKHLPEKVYVSFDIDGLHPSLCPHTGTPVPGGLQYEEAMYLVKLLVINGKKIIGFDLCEVNGEHEWDGNVGARVLYKLANLMGWSNSVKSVVR